MKKVTLFLFLIVFVVVAFGVTTHKATAYYLPVNAQFDNGGQYYVPYNATPNYNYAGNTYTPTYAGYMSAAYNTGYGFTGGYNTGYNTGYGYTGGHNTAYNNYPSYGYNTGCNYNCGNYSSNYGYNSYTPGYGSYMYYY